MIGLENRMEIDLETKLHTTEIGLVWLWTCGLLASLRSKPK